MSVEESAPHRLGFMKKPSLGMDLYYWVLDAPDGQVTESLPFPSLPQAANNAVDVFKADLLDEDRLMVTTSKRTRNLVLSAARKRYEKVAK